MAEHINHHSLRMLDSYGMADETILLGANPQSKNPSKIYSITDENHSFLVNNFEQIGWFDPFPSLEKPSGNSKKKSQLQPIKQEGIEQYKKNVIDQNKKLLSQNAIFREKQCNIFSILMEERSIVGKVSMSLVKKVTLRRTS